MCACDESPGAAPSCSRCVPRRTLTGHADFRYVTLAELRDTDEWTEAEAAGSRWEHTISSQDFNEPFRGRDAA